VNASERRTARRKKSRHGDFPASTSRAPAGSQLADGMPAHPLGRFLIAFLVFTPVFWLAAIGYSQESPTAAIEPAIVIGLLLALVSMTGKRTLGFLLKFLST